MGVAGVTPTSSSLRQVLGARTGPTGQPLTRVAAEAPWTWEGAGTDPPWWLGIQCVHITLIVTPASSSISKSRLSNDSPARRCQNSHLYYHYIRYFVRDKGMRNSNLNVVYPMSPAFQRNCKHAIRAKCHFRMLEFSDLNA